MALVESAAPKSGWLANKTHILEVAEVKRESVIVVQIIPILVDYAPLSINDVAARIRFEGFDNPTNSARQQAVVAVEVGDYLGMRAL